MNKNIAPTNLCHCGNCPDIKCYHNPKNIKGVWCNCDHESAWKFTREYGCLKHPLIYQPIINELERRKDANRNNNGDFYEGLKTGYENSINLLKGEKL